ncbi:hypothetical protein BS78_02G301300 [Paspalum vaginatum]|nr:hypothetical protein BS78_02G301300 [Paspalum vaginatum]
MKNSWLLSFVLLLAASPLAVASWSRSRVSCWAGSSYAANSTYEANLHRLAAVLPADASASHGRNAYRAIGYWPNRLQATSTCRNRDGDCAACIAEAFKEVERTCPFHREAYLFSRNCSLRLEEFRIFSGDALGANTMAFPLAMGMVCQAFGLACMFISFLRAWRHDTKKGPII